jgi:septal ring factor EnvC (AmiA/AmiB activator)
MRPQIERWRAGCATIGALLLLAPVGCVQAPAPREALQAAELALDQARIAGAAQHARDELAQAQAKFEAAQAAIRAKANEDARLLAEQATMDARLARVEAQAVQSGAAAAQLRALLEQQHRRLTPGAAGS